MDEEEGGCFYEIPPISPVYQTKFQNSVICGTRGGDSFVKVIRPDATTLVCPAGTSPCPLTNNVETSAENTVCYPSSLIPASCPVTQIKFISSSDNTYKKDRNWIEGGNIGGMTLLYSKTFNSLPITATYVGQKPCM